MDKASEFADSSIEAYPEATAEEYEYKMVGKSIVRVLLSDALKPIICSLFNKYIY